MTLRAYQQKLKSEVYSAWSDGARVVMGVMPTGSGKTMTFTNIMSEHRGASIALAHRSELVSQMSLALGRHGLRHRVVGQSSTAKNCRAVNMNELGRNFVDPHARCAAASVQTLVRRPSEAWMREVTLVVVDEGHHLLPDNAWGKAVAMFPNACVLCVTATPIRADGKGLGRHADGMVDVMVEGPSMRSLIEAGHLTDYRLICPPSDIDLSAVSVSAGGDYSPRPLSAAVHQSHIVGDVVQHYLKFAAGKLGVTFATDVESATDIAKAYRQAGVPAEVISADTPDVLRAHLMHQFRSREILQLVNVDLLGEGVDVPAIEVVSMARPTQSLGLYMQQVGRALRPMDGKDKAIILDHVGNWTRHGLVDKPRVWTLDRRERKARSSPDDAIPIRVCPQCLSAYERILPACPFCGEPHIPATRGSPDAVEGDLHEMAPELLAKLRGEIAAVAATPKIPYGATPVIAGSIKKNHRLRIEALGSLGLAMAVYGGWRELEGDSVAETQRRFYFTFGVDVLSAQALGRADAEALEGRIRDVLQRANIAVDASVNT